LETPAGVPVLLRGRLRFLPARVEGEVGVVHSVVRQAAQLRGEAQLLAHGRRHLHFASMFSTVANVSVECLRVLSPLEWGPHVVRRSDDAEAHPQQVYSAAWGASRRSSSVSERHSSISILLDGARLLAARIQPLPLVLRRVELQGISPIASTPPLHPLHSSCPLNALSMACERRNTCTRRRIGLSQARRIAVATSIQEVHNRELTLFS